MTTDDTAKEPFRVPVRLFELGTVVATQGDSQQRRMSSGWNV